MSKGTKVFSLRIDDELFAAVHAAILKRNLHTRDEDWTFTDFMRAALREKLAKMERSRKGGGK